MNRIGKDIFRAIHEGKWLSIEYKNKEGKITKYWIGIKDINLKSKSLLVEGLHLTQYTLAQLYIYIDSILSSAVIDGSYCQINQRLTDDIRCNPHKYQMIFHHVPNLKILNYLADCNKLDTTPYKCEYSLIQYLDDDLIRSGHYRLNETQFKEIIKNFQAKSKQSSSKKVMNKIKQICMNILSIHTKKGLYVLAFRRLNLDVATKTLRPDDEITICREFTINGEKQSIRKFLDADDYYLLDDFEKNRTEVADRITHMSRQNSVDEAPYLIAIGWDQILDLNYEYSAIVDMYDADTVTYPIKAFFGELIKRPGRRKEYPLALLNNKVNLDQLLAIHNALKYPLAYIQGPPGTGKTVTIINTIITAFFNEKTVLFASYNNHPIDSVVETLQGISYKDSEIPFPIVRLGNNEKVAQALNFMKSIYEKTKNLSIYNSTLERNKDDKIERTKQLTALLKKHEEIIELEERRETIKKLIDANQNMIFQVDLQARQLQEIEERLKEIGDISEEEALQLITDDEETFRKYLFYTSAKYMKRLGEPKNRELLDIIYMNDDEERVHRFNQYISDDENMKKFLRIFPIVATTCISAHKLGEPKPYFDMVIIDEASQCNTAVSLVPIIRGESLMLVGDPQQLNPVILLDAKDNQKLRRNYSVSSEYDYIDHSIYKTFLACDAVSDEILLSYHYRCHEKIIEFNNKKYYNQKLKVKSKSGAEEPLILTDIKDSRADVKNTAPAEAEQVVEYAVKHPEKKIGVITPFVNQNICINERLRESKIKNVISGTVHAFQGDEKDVILFSLALTDQTYLKTYHWLKNNKELINVATSRAKDQLIVLCSCDNLQRLHGNDGDDDVFELVEYVQTNGSSEVTSKAAQSRALGIKPYSTETENAFLINLNHALDNIQLNRRKYVIYKEVGIAHVFKNNDTYNDLFYTGRFDFVVYEKFKKKEIPVFAIELDGKEHVEDEIVQERDRKKNEICRKHGFELIRVENSYARRYNYIKDILIQYFSKIK